MKFLNVSIFCLLYVLKRVIAVLEKSNEFTLNEHLAPSQTKRGTLCSLTLPLTNIDCQSADGSV